ncbi:6-phosphogluconate dehydrogenase [Paractinoplanes rishiriensis]|uniref:6-phosphogluconate dehydrogenase n=2 Tax=Paractinoplanes rishiriensis TaxID=1050105 RepID=A0A919K8W0_9ACTN|nr:6-phosphogluconate dehydrogenase [Actinoplanes rishiriensis]
MAAMDNRITVIGTGAIGGAVTRRLLAAGRDVVVWNRTAARVAPLVAAGARPADSIAAATASSRLVLLTLTDYAAVRECLAQFDGHRPGLTVVALCTGTPHDAQQAAQQAARYLDGGVQAAPEAIGTASATFLFSGSRDAFDEHAATLGLLGSVRFVGEAPEAAAIWDLTLFGVWYDAQLGLLRALETVRAAGVDVTDFAGTAGKQLGYVVSAVTGTAAEVQRGVYPSGPATLPEHLTVIRQLLEHRAGHRLGDGGLAAVAARIETLVAAGHGSDGLTATVSEAGSDCRVTAGTQEW